MSIQSAIEWTDATWNPVRGCTKISPGCKHCYAQTFAERWRGTPGHPFEHGFDLTLAPHKLDEPLKWRSPKRVFVNSMSDLFHAGVDDAYVASVFDVMERANWHQFQLLTKRAERMQSFVRGRYAGRTMPRNLWLGVSVEDRKYGLPRLEMLRQCEHVAVRFLSIEPLLEDLGEIDLAGIGWVIVGGESGPGARPIRAEWVRSIRDQCESARVPFFFKQWGGVQKKRHGRVLDGETYSSFPRTLAIDAPTARRSRSRQLLHVVQ